MTVADRLDGLMDTKGIKNRSELARLSGIPYTTIVGVYEKDLPRYFLMPYLWEKARIYGIF